MKRLHVYGLIILVLFLAGMSFVPQGWGSQEEDPKQLIQQADELVAQAQSVESIREALEKYRIAETLLLQAGMKAEIGWIFLKTGCIHRDLGDYEKTESLFRGTLDSARMAGSLLLEASIFNELAVLYLSRCEIAPAKEALTKALKVARNMRFAKVEADALRHLGRLYRLTGHPKEARESYEKSLTIYRSIEDKRGEAQALSGIAWGLFWSGNGTEAGEHYERALALAQSAGDAAGEGWIRLNLGDMYRQNGKPAKAMEHAVKVLQMSRNLSNPRLEGYGYNALGLVHHASTDYDSAIDMFHKALGIAEKVKDSQLESYALGNEGLSWHNRKQYHKSMKLQERALTIVRQVPLPWIEANQLHNLGMNYADTKQYAKALQLYRDALKIRERLNDTRYAVNHINAMGLVFMDTGKLDMAAESFEETLKLASDVGNRIMEGWALNNLGEIARRQGRYGQAIELYRQALALAREITYPRLEEFALINMNRAYLTQGNSAKALQLFQQVQALKARNKKSPDDPALLVSQGNAYLVSGQYRKAVQSFEKSLKAARKTKNEPAEADALSGLGMESMVTGKMNQAAKYYEDALRIVEKGGDPQDEARLLMGLMTIYTQTGKHAETAKVFARIMKLEGKIQDPQAKAALLSGLTMFRPGRGGGKATSLSQKALELAESMPDPQARCTLLLALSQARIEAQDYQEAEKLARKALRASTKIKFPLGEASAQNLLGKIYDDTGQYAKAAEALNRATTVAREMNDRKMEMISVSRLGQIYLWWGRYKDAADCFDKAREISAKIGDRLGESAALTSLGEIYKSRGEYNEALKAHQEAVKIAEKENIAWNYANGLAYIGRIHELKADHEAADKALDYYQKALSLSKQLKISTGWAEDIVGNYYLNKGEIDKAEPYIRQGGSTASLGRLHLVESDFAKSTEYYKKLAALGEENRNADNLFAAYTGLGLCAEATGDNGSAADYFLKALRVVEELRSGLPPEQREKFFQVRVKGFFRTTPYEGLARVLLKSDKPLDAWKYSEYTKARVFAEFISKGNGAGATGVPKDVLKTEKSLLEQVASLKTARDKAYEKDNKLLAQLLAPVLKPLQENLAKHITMLRKQYPLYAATRYPEPMDLDQTGLSDGDWTLSYDVTDFGVLVYLTEGTKLVKAVFKPIKREDLGALIEAFREPLLMTDGVDEDKLAAFDFRAGKKLADLLLTDAVSLLPSGAHVIVVPDDCLAELPFEMLVLNKGGRVVRTGRIPSVSGADFFGDRNSISYCQSVTALTLARALEGKRKHCTKTLVVDDPVFDPKDSRVQKDARLNQQEQLKWLPSMLMSIKRQPGLVFERLHLSKELGEALKKSDPNNTDRLTGFTATKKALLDKDLDSYKSMILATHGYFGTGWPGVMEPVLVLTLVNQPTETDGLLTMSEVLRLKLNADMVALTACQSGLGKQISGEGTMGMGRAFQYAGAKACLMSLWNVSEDTSVKLVERFFAHLKEGKSKLEALRLARQEVRQGGFDHPFFWASFILVGEVK